MTDRSTCASCARARKDTPSCVRDRRVGTKDTFLCEKDRCVRTKRLVGATRAATYRAPPVQWFCAATVIERRRFESRRSAAQRSAAQRSAAQRAQRSAAQRSAALSSTRTRTCRDERVQCHPLQRAPLCSAIATNQRAEQRGSWKGSCFGRTSSVEVPAPRSLSEIVRAPHPARDPGGQGKQWCERVRSKT